MFSWSLLQVIVLRSQEQARFSIRAEAAALSALQGVRCDEDALKYAMLVWILVFVGIFTILVPPKHPTPIPIASTLNKTGSQQKTKL